jgi:hypothetical protein
MCAGGAQNQKALPQRARRKMEKPGEKREKD